MGVADTNYLLLPAGGGRRSPLAQLACHTCSGLDRKQRRSFVSVAGEVRVTLEPAACGRK